MSLAAASPLVLVGAGKMGSAMLDGWLEQGLAPAGVTLVDPGAGDHLKDYLARGATHVARAGEVSVVPAVVILAVKPQMMAEVLAEVRPIFGPETLVVSVAAGTTLAALEAGLGAAAIVRVMPNTPAQVGRGMSVCVGNDKVGEEGRALVTALMSAVGETAWIDDEALIDAVTGVSGSGPAYVFLMAEVLAEAGRAAGLPDELAARLARQTVVGAGELLRLSPLDPATLRQNVTSPNGTTFAALQVLMGEGGMKPLMEKAVAAATARSRELAG
ncbi:Pyrroline-5-carboxylate reductase [Hartmannibacter diazotrophicus]|uniref:Pyrroline-5-carboxylate reductase n=1 Tax=Hartmannibacter diazotrophicus TaxID=1482074 RepID=A0A2C9D9T9_9HYPH|nr:pyrroline-5-carboxylate reductase [Hartmannibacter diazotrophicus]SON57057.1 Pyrroline-5-carboxylate reductase [Hartmannibacter diazotrophicus]